ncbi:MAG: 3-oxoacyl-[acyl-carrier protein] reductase, partial [Chloroflexota bacterium]|nr:3-oxoacyl-[acyl-carrier protein] reductase [Chloroflexota bacterium]
IMRMSVEAFREVVETNLFGAFYMTKAVTRPMLKAKGGRIVNMSSVSGQAGQTGQANYSASKAGLIGLTKATARELASRSITCNAVAPGFVLTELTSGLSEALQAQITAATPLGRFGTTEEIANAVAFLVSDEAAFITGQVLAVDGGLVMM